MHFDCFYKCVFIAVLSMKMTWQYGSLFPSCENLQFHGRKSIHMRFVYCLSICKFKTENNNFI